MLGHNVRYHHDVRPRPKMITALHRAWAAIPLNDIRQLLVRCINGALPVCELTEGISLTKHSVTFKNDPYPVLLHFTKSVLNLNV